MLCNQPNSLKKISENSPQNESSIFAWKSDYVVGPEKEKQENLFVV